MIPVIDMGQKECLNCDKPTFLIARIIIRDSSGKPILAKYKNPVPICENCLPMDRKMSLFSSTARAKAAFSQGYQSMGLSACCCRYTESERPRRFTYRDAPPLSSDHCCFQLSSINCWLPGNKASTAPAGDTRAAASASEGSSHR